MSRKAFGLGQADVICEYGRKGRVFYTYQDEYTGKAVGQGAMHSGEKIKIWSGTNVLEYLRGDTGERIAYLPCDGGSILMGCTPILHSCYPSVHDIRPGPVFLASLGVECEQGLIVDGIGVDDLCCAL